MFYVLLLIHSLYSAALQGTRPIVSIYADGQGASALVIGLLVSTYALFPMLLAVRTGRWLDQYGARFMVTIGATGMLVSLLVPMLYPSLGTLFFSQILRGFAQLFVHLSLQKTVGNLPGHRDKWIAAFTLTGSLGELLGPLISGFSYEHFGFRVSLGISCFIILLALVIGFMMEPTAWKSGASSLKHNYQTTGSAWKMLRQVNLRNALIISGLVLYSKDLFVAYFPVYGSDVGLSPGSIGGIISIMGAMSMVVRLIQFQLVQAFGRGTVLMITLIISGISYLLIPGTVSFLCLAVLAGLLGVGLGLGQPLSLVYALNVTRPERHGEVLGVRITFNRVSQFAAPFLFGGIGGFAGLAPIFWISGGILLIGSYFTRIRAIESDENALTMEKGNMNVR
ncbi:MFS transporter [Effusibacillus lacus]|uniref:MFS transporter n=1 Tax=Effusibacillus lacus TaxID=1348429 RepID=A0A292YJS0_9BACL|nr:MFS transporter [Effusibacillus lacus]TCS76136.1 putative MFS family arabinose efflux permease [Effusibacillus lacus]GAX91357.1 MFS transporter [Effusibacillus lacus]